MTRTNKRAYKSIENGSKDLNRPFLDTAVPTVHTQLAKKSSWGESIECWAIVTCWITWVSQYVSTLSMYEGGENL